MEASGRRGRTASCRFFAQYASNVGAFCSTFKMRLTLHYSDGAALFYTTPLPATLQVLRQYALHLLFAPPAPSPAMGSPDAPAPIRNPFPFNHKPNPLDRDHLVIPAGWDSWGKIEIVRQFEPKSWGEAWDREVDTDEPLPADEVGISKMYSALVPDQGSKVCILRSTRCTVHLCPVSRRHCLPSTAPYQSRRSLPRTMTRTRRSLIAILEERSAILQILKARLPG